MKTEGIGGGWRGNGVNMVRIIPQNAVAFSCKVKIKDAINSAFGTGPIQTISSSSLSGMICITAVYPLDLVRGRLTTSPGAYTGLLDAIKKITSSEGLAALYKGCSHANAWAVPYYAATFASYDYAKKFYVERRDGSGGGSAGDGKVGGGGGGGVVSPVVGLFLGMFAGCCGTLCGFPLESARRKCQLQGVSGRPVLYDGLADCVRKVVRKEGIGGIFRGVTANLVKMAPASAITFACYEEILKTLKVNF